MQFSDLPPDMQGYLVRSQPVAASSVSKQVRRVSSYYYLTELCEQPISKNEIISYIRSQTSSINLIYHVPNIQSDLVSERIQIVVHHYKGYINTILGGETYLSHFLLTLAPIDELIDNILNSPIIEIDLISQFNIFRNRVGCISRDPYYAQKQVLKVLDGWYNRRLSNLYLTHMFLSGSYRSIKRLIQASILGAIQRGLDPRLTFPTTDVEVRNQIDFYYQQLKDYFSNLPLTPPAL